MSKEVKLFADKINSLRSSEDTALQLLFEGNTIIDKLLLQVCSICQNDCKDCIHGTLRSIYEGYQLSLEDLENFLYYTKKSKYYIREICIQGIGEPTLWEHLNEGIKLIHDSGVVGRITLVSNGMSLDNINEDTWQYLHNVMISLYHNFENVDLLDSLKEKYSDKIEDTKMDEFIEIPDRHYPDTIPCRCLCPIPMVIKDKIFFYCISYIAIASSLMNSDPLSYTEMYSDIKENYLETRHEYKDDVRDFNFCEYCFFNIEISARLKRNKHEAHIVREVVNE